MQPLDPECFSNCSCVILSDGSFNESSCPGRSCDLDPLTLPPSSPPSILFFIAMAAYLLLLASFAYRGFKFWRKLSSTQRHILLLFSLIVLFRFLSVLVVPSTFGVLSNSCTWPHVVWVQFYIAIGSPVLLILKHIAAILGSAKMLKVTKQAAIAYAAAASISTALSVAFAASSAPPLLILSRVAMIPLSVVIVVSAIRTVLLVRAARLEAKALVGSGRGPSDPAVFGYRKIGHNVNLFAGTTVGGAVAFFGLILLAMAQGRSVTALTVSSLIDFVVLAVLALAAQVTFALTRSRRSLSESEGGGGLLHNGS